MNTPISAADMRRLSENKPISVQDICDRWQISRPTVMAAISSRKLIGDKHFGKWFFHPSAVVEWRGEAPPPQEAAPATPVAAAPAGATDNTAMAALLKMAEEHIATLREQLDVKDRQLADQQETMREQMRLLTYAGPALSKSGDEVAELKAELAKKDEQVEKMARVTAEKVAQLVKGQRRAARPKVQTVADRLKKEE